MFDFVNMIGTYESRKVDLWNSEDGDMMVSTCSVTDGDKPFETAIMHPMYKNGKMVIVDKYDTKEAAQIGHDKWLNLILTDKLPATLVDCANAGISQLVEGFGGTIAFERGKAVKKDEG